MVPNLAHLENPGEHVNVMDWLERHGCAPASLRERLGGPGRVVPMPPDTVWREHLEGTWPHELLDLSRDGRAYTSTALTIAVEYAL